MATTDHILFTAEQTTAIIGRAWKDPIFKQALLTNANDALVTFLDMTLPIGLTLTVVEETASSLCLVLPATPELASSSNRPAIEAQIVARAEADSGFRTTLLADPAAALQAHFGMFLPEGMTVRVCAESATQRYLVLPLDPTAALAEHELSDLELLTVAGGGRTYRPGGNPNCQLATSGSSRSTQVLNVRRRATSC